MRKKAAKKTKSSISKKRPGGPYGNKKAYKHGLFGSMWRKSFTKEELAAIDSPIGAVEMAEELVKIGRARMISAAKHLSIMTKDGTDEDYEKAQRLFTHIQTETRQAVKTLVEAQAALGDLTPPLVEATIEIPGLDGALIVNPLWNTPNEIQQTNQNQDRKCSDKLCSNEITDGDFEE